MFQDHSGVHLLQVHRKLSELYGRIFSSSTHTQQHRSSRKRRKLEDGSAESAEQQLPPRIVLQFRGSPPNKMKRVKDEVCTKFIMRKTNLVSSSQIVNMFLLLHNNFEEHMADMYLHCILFENFWCMLAMNSILVCSQSPRTTHMWCPFILLSAHSYSLLLSHPPFPLNFFDSSGISRGHP